MNLRNYVAGLWVVSNPRIAYRAARGFARAFFGRPTLKIIELFPTFSCPQNCPMCSVEKYKIRRDEKLSIEDYRRIAKEGARMGAIAVTFLGGEPFVYRQLPELVSIFRTRGFFCNIVTGGGAVTPEKLSALRAMGIGSIHFSLESLDAGRNDPIRGKGHLAATLENLKRCRELGIRAGLAPIFAPGRMTDCVEIIRYCRDHGLLVAASQAAPVGLNENAMLLSSAEHDEIRRLVRIYPHLTLDWTMSYFLRQQCPAGKEKIGITCHGDVIGCSINSIGFGNVKEESLRRIWTRMTRFSQFAADSPVCLSAESESYVEKYLRPVHAAAQYPLNYRDHPRMGPEYEPGMY